MNVELPFPTCERVTGVIGNVLYVVRHGGAWELFRRGRGMRTVIDGGTAEGIAAGAVAARKRAQLLTKSELEADDAS